MNTELTNQGATASGSSPIKVTFTASERQYTINQNGTIEYSGTKIKSDNSIQISVNERATESRAVILEATAIIDGKRVPLSIKEWLQNMTSEELKKMWVKMESSESESNYEEYWNSHYTGYTDVKDYYENYSWNELDDSYDYDVYVTNYIRDQYDDEYEMMIDLGKVDENLYNSKYYLTYTCNGKTVTGSRGEFIITRNGTYTVTASKGDEIVTSTANITNCVNRIDDQLEIFAYPTDRTQNYTFSQDDYEVVIPAGFAYGISNNIGTISKGLVITDNIDENGNSIGNEFVWIPINKTDLTVKNTNKKMAILQNESNTDYRGMIYDWYNDNTGNTAYPWNSDSVRNWEPAYLDNLTDDDPHRVLTTEVLQNEFNTMVESVKRFGGFYVSRYEMGIDENIKPISKLGVKPAVSGEIEWFTGQYDEQKRGWYGLYYTAKEYKMDSVMSAMIWACQYDAMLNFALTNPLDSIKVNANNQGNHENLVLATGTYEGSDSINNVFDLQGNLSDWTQAAHKGPFVYGRIARGAGIYGNGTAWSFAPSEPGYTPNYLGTRIVIYIK